MLEAGDVLIGVGTTEELRLLEELFAPAESPLPADAIERLEAALGEASRAPTVALERPGDAAHGDYATNVAMRLAGVRSRRRRAIARGARRARPPRWPTSTRAEVAGPGFVNLWLAPAWYGDALGGDPRRRRPLRRRLGGDAASTSRSRSSPRTRPARSPSPHARNGAYGDSGRAPARVRGPRGRARVLLQRRRRADGALPRARWTRSGAGRSRRRTATTAPTSPSSRALRAIRCRRCCERIEATLRPLPDRLRRVGARERARSSGCRSSCRGSTPTRRTARSGRARPRTGTTRTAC